MQNRRRAFTLLEVLIVISIVVVLIGLVTVGVRHLSKSAKQTSTRVTLSALRGMLAEAESTGTVSKLPGLTILAVADGATANDKFGAVAMDASMEEGGSQRFGQEAIRTQRALRALLSLPNNRKAYEQLPAESKLRVRYQSGVRYIPGDQVEHTIGANTKLYVCTAATSAPPGGAGWSEDTTPHTALLADGWGNPILFVRGVDPRAVVSPAIDPYLTNLTGSYGLTNVTLATSTGNVIVNPQSVPWDPTNRNNLKLYRPFWASAGPDANFLKGDDNLYSFEQ